MIKKNNICFRFWSDFATKKLSATADNNSYYYVGSESETMSGEPDIPYHAFVVIKDKQWVWTRGQLLKWVVQEDLDVVKTSLGNKVNSATFGALSTRVTNLETYLEENEEITANAFVDLNARLEALTERVTALETS